MATYTVILPRWEQLDRHVMREVMRGTGDAHYARILAAGEFQAYRLEAGDEGEVYERLNEAHPADYRMRSLSVGDLILDEHGTVTLIAGAGFREIDLPQAGRHADAMLDGCSAGAP